MKALLMILCWCILTTTAYSQEDAANLKFYMHDDWTMWSPIQKQAPSYPNKLVKKKIEGCVNLLFDIQSNGVPGKVRILKSVPEGVFDKYAILALAAFKYQATKSNPNRIPVLTHNIFTFSLESNDESRAKWVAVCEKI